MKAEDLIEFESEVARLFDLGKIHGPVHLNSPGQAEHLLSIFKEVKHTDWVLGTWRSHWHALLKGVPRQLVLDEILAGRSMMLHFPQYRFMTSAIVGGMLPAACGLAAGGHTVWCFVGDMAATTGAFADALRYADRNGLKVHFVVEDNGLSTDTPTDEAWGPYKTTALAPRQYSYKRIWPHYQPYQNLKGF